MEAGSVGGRESGRAHAERGNGRGGKCGWAGEGRGGEGGGGAAGGSAARVRGGEGGAT